MAQRVFDDHGYGGEFGDYRRRMTISWSSGFGGGSLNSKIKKLEECLRIHILTFAPHQRRRRASRLSAHVHDSNTHTSENTRTCLMAT